ncbi:MAG: DUF3955 domain-containing protein [Roseiflexaceae bacterium]
MSTQSIWWRISLLLVISALVTIVMFMTVGSYVDANGMLHESFFLIPLFWGLSFASIITAVIALIVRRAR